MYGDGVTDTQGSEGLYTGGEYAERHPTWHIEDSPWKADQIARMVELHGLAPRKVVEVGCGAGEVLRQVHERLPEVTECVGYEISPQAFEMTKERAAPGMRFELADFAESEESDVDLLLVIDVIEHVEDYLGFLRSLQGRARHTILHVPLDLSIEWMLRVSPLVNERRTMGHIHYFTKEITLEALRDTGYEVVGLVLHALGHRPVLPVLGVSAPQGHADQDGAAQGPSAQPVRAEPGSGGPRHARVVVDGARPLTPRSASNVS